MKQKYRYNPKTLSYEKHQVSWGRKIAVFFGFLSVALIFGFCFFIVYTSLFGTQEERKLERENAKLQTELKVFEKDLLDLNEVLGDLESRDDNLYRVVFEAEPVSDNIREAGYGGASRADRYQGYRSSDLLIRVDSTIQRLKRKLYIQSVSYDELEKLAQRKEEMLASIPAIQPISNKDLTRLASGFGYRIHPIYKRAKFHTGIDFTCKRGTHVYATGDGVVEKADGSSRGYGNMVTINHGYGYKTNYAHLSKFAVRPGQRVKRGQLIAYSGNTGLSTGPHVHYEVEKNGEKIDPINFFFNDLTPKEYGAIVELANQKGQSFD